MKPLSLQDIRQAVAGKSLSPLPAVPPQITAVCTNTREMEKSSLFVALRGENFDGHAFLESAAAGGAVAAVVDHPPENPPAGLYLIEAANTRLALGKLSRRVRQDLR